MIAGYVPAATETDPAKLARAIRNIYENTLDSTAINAAIAAAVAGISGSVVVPQGRLTLSSGVPVMNSTVAATGTLYYTPHVGNVLPLYTGSAWVNRTFAETSIALSAGTASKPHDVFGYDNSGTLALEILAWTNDTTRATALTRQDGFLVKSGDATRHFLGTIYLDGSKQCQWTFGTQAAGGGAAVLQVWNNYNRVNVGTVVTDDNLTWTYTSGTVRQLDNSAGNRITFISGLALEQPLVRMHMTIIPNTGVAGSYGAAGFALDDAAPALPDKFGVVQIGGTGSQRTSFAVNMNYPAQLGYHFIQALEAGDGANAATFQGQGGQSLNFNLGM